MDTTFGVIILLIITNCIYFAVRAKKIKNEGKGDTDNGAASSRAFRRSLLGAAAGFLTLSTACWFYLTSTGRFVAVGDQYAGPPGLMTCMVVGLLGVIPGSLLGLVGKSTRKGRIAA